MWALITLPELLPSVAVATTTPRVPLFLTLGVGIELLLTWMAFTIAALDSVRFI